MILHLPPGAPALLRAAAATALGLHIAGGLLGIGSGAAAMFFRKGSWAHAIAGKTFVASMLVMAGIGAAVSPFLPQRANVVMGLFVCYLVLTGLQTISRRDAGPRRVEFAAMSVGVAATLAGILFGLQALTNPIGLLDGDGPWNYWVLASLPMMALAGDVNVILRGGVVGTARTTRHLWRMGVALLIATFSLVLGQPKVFPAVVRGTPLLFLPVVAVLAAVIYWLVRVRIAARPRLKGMPRPEPLPT